ncbi:protein of unknown function [Candidatus Bipolaricaulis anaerobius]|uniref:Uncharacterized protein n=1 Tax=Candidatus Bipolaricaulis anaerobius TaxID=2026885 RepID=A0A2X3L092_9BACT|nr:protein of unknown function [Candidatus Bipolaricaulis anaerobius]
MVGTDRTRPGADRLAGQVQVLAHVARIHGDHLVRGHAVPPLRAVGDGCPREHDRRLAHELLPQAPRGNLRREVWIRTKEYERVVKGEVPVQSRCEARDPVHDEVRLKRVTRPRRGHGAQAGHPVTYDPLHALDGPQEERELLQGERIRGEPAAAAAGGDGIAEGNLAHTKRLRIGELHDGRPVRRGPLERGMGDPLPLVGLDLLRPRPGCSLQELATKCDFVHRALLPLRGYPSLPWTGAPPHRAGTIPNAGLFAVPAALAKLAGGKSSVP